MNIDLFDNNECDRICEQRISVFIITDNTIFDMAYNV